MTPLARATDAAARVLGVPSTFMSGYSRAPRVVAGRDAVWAALRDQGVPWSAIAAATGRNENTVKHGVKVARARAAVDAAYAEAIRAIAEEVKA
jgi:transglutaminase-like putative cysteine protease